MGITYGDHLIDSGYYDITPEQERESEAREECERRGIDPDELCADGGVEAWMVVAKEISAPVRAEPVAWQWRFKLIDGSWSDWNDGRARDWVKEGPEKREYEERPLYADASACERLSNELDPEIGFPTDDLLRRIHLDIETRGRKNPAFAVSVHHRNIVLSAVAHALRKRDLSWEEWLVACGWPSGDGTCECYRPGDCDGSCTHPEPAARTSISVRCTGTTAPTDTNSEQNDA